jgi:hypothetical protein
LGVTLVERVGRDIALTEQGGLFSQFVQAGFDGLLEGVRRVSKNVGHDRINVNVSPYFATRCLLDRLGPFRHGRARGDAGRPGSRILFHRSALTPPAQGGCGILRLHHGRGLVE